MGAGDHVPEVAVDRVDEERLAERVPVVPPGIGRAVAEHLEPLATGVIAPEAAAERNARRPRACRARRSGPATRPRTGRRASRRAPSAGRWRTCDGSRSPTVKPSSTTSAGPSGTSSPSRSGTNKSCGGHISQTPPSPSSTLPSLWTLSVKTVRLSNAAVAVGVLEDQHAVAQAEVELLAASAYV